MKIAVVIPSYKVKRHVLGVLEKIGPEVSAVYVVDDCCPEGSGEYVARECRDPRVRVVRLERNRGVGGATMAGYEAAFKDGADVAVKLDGDGQMDPSRIRDLVRPIEQGRADYSKGNRFYSIEALASMPLIRLIGNSGLSFLTKLSSGYWNVMDPTNGFTALHRTAFGLLPLGKIENRYFFESDLLFRLNTVRAVVADVPFEAVYGDEVSNLDVRKALFEFGFRHLARIHKRVFYNYILRDFNAVSFQLIFGMLFFLGGATLGIWKWVQGSLMGQPATSGTVMLAALPVILGFQMLLGALQLDVQNMPRVPLQSGK